jgi:chemotaxis protein MotA
MMRRGNGMLGLAGLSLGVSIVAWAHVSMGGDLRLFLQPEALAVVFGGTLAALLVSFPGRALRDVVTGIASLSTRRRPVLDALVPAFIGFARKARRLGPVAVEREVLNTSDEFLQRALTLSVSGLSAEVVRQALDIEARVCAERDDERAQILEAAAGYAPTLGIVGAVLGLMRAMSQIDAGGGVGFGIASAFVATIYGVGAANLIFLPLATRLRSRARHDALCRELMIEGGLALRDGASPGVVEERLAGYLNLKHDRSQPSAGVA